MELVINALLHSSLEILQALLSAREWSHWNCSSPTVSNRHSDWTARWLLMTGRDLEIMQRIAIKTSLQLDSQLYNLQFSSTVCKFTGEGGLYQRIEGIVQTLNSNLVLS